MTGKIPPTNAFLFLVSDKTRSILTTKSTSQRFYYPAGYTELPTFNVPKDFTYTNDNGTLFIKIDLRVQDYKIIFIT